MVSLPLDLIQPGMLALAVVTIVLIIAVLFAGSLLVPGATPEGVGKAITCYFLKAAGVLLMILSFAQIGYGLMFMQLPDGPYLLSALLIFIVGVGLLIHESRVLATIDPASSAVPRQVFSHACEVIGTLITLFGVLILAINFIFLGNVEGWQGPVVLMLLGTMLSLPASFYAQKGKRWTVTSVTKKKGKK